MTAPYLGGFAVTKMAWLSQVTLVAEFSSTYGSTYAYQIYVGRTLAGKQANPAARTITATMRPSNSPQPVTLLAVSPANINTDYGSLLPREPYNRVRLRFATSSWPADSQRIEVAAGTAPGGAVDADNIIGRHLFDADGEFEILTDPFERTGTWNLEVAGRDNRSPDGNRGTAVALSVSVVVYPPDFEQDANGRRFSVSIASQTATFSYSVA